MDILHAIILGIIEGIAEFLPISSTGHLTIAEKLMGYQINDPGVTAFTAVIQIGSIMAAILYFRKDIIRIATAWLAGLLNGKKRKDQDYKFGWAIILGSIPIAVVGLLFKEQIETTLRSLWFVVAGLIIWGIVMLAVDKTAKAQRKEGDITWRDTLVIGLAQCMALIPGVSRSGATISVGLMRGIDRVTATKLSFFLGMPALLAAGALQIATEAHHIESSVGWLPTIVATISSFIVGYVVIAWLLKYISKHNFSLFIWYRLALGVVIAALLVSGTISAT